jgi:hypothetical protein
MKHIHYLWVILAAIVVVACNSNTTKSTDSKSDTTQSPTSRSRTFDPHFDVSSFVTIDDYRHAMDHYWDDFDFEAGDRVKEYDSLAMTQAMVDFVAYLSQEPLRERRDSLLRNMMQRASTSRPVLDYFASMSEVVLHDPNSPLRNDEFYIPILEVIVASPLLDEYELIAPMYDLELARQNRIGEVANDIVYTLANGRTGRLHNIDTDYVILMFSNPGCPMCREIREEITASPLINELTENGSLKTIAIYPDEDLEAWRDHASDIPQSWINAYDQGMTITAERSYNLQAIPALYLLDSEKRVIIKDGTSVAQIENAIAYLDAM